MRWQPVYADAQPLSGNGRDYIRLRIHWESTGVLSTSSRPTLHMRSVVLATCETRGRIRGICKSII